MLKDERIQIRVSSEMLDYVKANYENVSLFIRDAMKEKLESGLLPDTSLDFIEVRAKSCYTYNAKLDSVVDGDTVVLNLDLGFYLTIKERIRLIGIDCPPIDTKEGKKAKAFIEKELTKAHIIVETRKKEVFGRYLGYIYYSDKFSSFEEIIRHGKLLNEELVKAKLANKYKKTNVEK